MPKRILPITVKEIKKFKDGRHAVGGVPNLYVDIKNGNISFWLLRDQKNFKKNLTYPRSMTLEQVRAQARNDIELKLQGKDPKEERKALIELKKQQEEESRLQDLEAKSTLEHVTDEWFKKEALVGRWIGNGEYKEYNRLKKDIFPVFGNRPISTITPQDMAKLFNGLYLKKHNTAIRIQRYLRYIFAWAKVSKQFGTVVSPFNDEFDELTRTARTNKPLTNNRPALPFAEIPSLIKELLEKGDPVSLAITFSILTATRGQAIRLAQWCEIDFNKATWTIPRDHDKVKTAKEQTMRTVFLSKQAVALLKKLHRLTNQDSELLFPPNPARPFKPMTADAMAKHLRDMHKAKFQLDGIGWIDPKLKDEKTGDPKSITQHGTARAGFQTWAMESPANYDDNAVALCLFHKIDDKYTGAYKRGELESKRKAIMQDWANQCLKGISIDKYSPKM